MFQGDEAFALHEEDLMGADHIAEVAQAFRLEDDEIDLRKGGEKGDKFLVIFLVADIDDELPLWVGTCDGADSAEKGACHAAALFYS